MTEKAESNAAEKSEAVRAGYDRVANPENAQKSQLPEKEALETDAPETEITPTAETPPDELTFTNDQIKDVMAQVSRIPDLEKRLRDEGGRYGALKQSLEQLQQKLTVATTANPVDVEDMLKEIKDDLGEDNSIYLSLKSAFGKVMSNKAVDPELIDKMVSDKIKAAKQAEEDAAEAILVEAHPTWEQDVRSTEFVEWMGTLPERERKRIMRSDDPEFISDKLDTFKEWKTAKTRIPEAKPPEAKQNTRLMRAVMPTNGTKPKTPGEDDAKASIRAGYERVAGARMH